MWRRVGGKLLLASALVGAVTQLMPALPREQTLVFRLPAHAAGRLTVVWTRAGDSAQQGGFSLAVEGSSRRLEHRLSAPNGDYDLHMSLQRSAPDSADESRYHPDPSTLAAGATRATTTYYQRVHLQGGTTDVRLRDESP